MPYGPAQFLEASATIASTDNTDTLRINRVQNDTLRALPRCRLLWANCSGIDECGQFMAIDLVEPNGTVHALESGHTSHTRDVVAYQGAPLPLGAGYQIRMRAIAPRNTGSRYGLRVLYQPWVASGGEE